MKIRKMGRNAALILLLLVSAMPAGAREEQAARRVEAGGWGWMWAAVVEWVEKLGPGIDPNGAMAPGFGEEDGGDPSDVGLEIDPNG